MLEAAGAEGRADRQSGQLQRGEERGNCLLTAQEGAVGCSLGRGNAVQGSVGGKGTPGVLRRPGLWLSLQRQPGHKGPGAV